MSRTSDEGKTDYAPTQRLNSPSDSEPADPANPNHAARDNLPLIPPSVSTACLPDPLTDGERPLTVGEARKTYLKIERASWNSDSRTSKYMRHRKELYPRLLEADRQLQERYDGLTTAMLTRRLSPLDEGEWLTPWECVSLLHGGTTRRRVRRCLNRHIALPFEWVAVTAPTESAGTPHEHIYLWIDDPENEVGVTDLAPALEKHLDGVATAYERHHEYEADGSGGAITVKQTPPCTQTVPEKFFQIREASEASARPNTSGAFYLARQLAHLPVGDFYNSNEPNPAEPLLDGGALAWASGETYRWFRASQGIPEL
jgi:hypothetical protein